MKTTAFLFFTLVLINTGLYAQDDDLDRYFTLKPADIETRDSELQEYDVVLKWQNLDATSGMKFNCNGVHATYIAGPDPGIVRWKNISIAQLDNMQQNHFEGEELPAFNGFTYRAMDTAFLAEEFYRDIPADQQDLAKWLVSDAVQMHGLASYVFDSLDYNQAFYPELLTNYDIKFENWVTFSSRQQKLTWTGLGKHNDEICAIVRFESLYNPVIIDNEQMSMEGRALYYGEIWISLTDKQVEYASMVEDDIIKLRSAVFPDEKMLDLQREIVFNKVN